MNTFIDVFLEQVRAYPDRPAVMDARGAITYTGLNRRSALLAGKILESFHSSAQAGNNSARVALLLPRRCDYLIALLAVVRAGCAVVPLDAEYPPERIQAIQEDAGCRLFITTGALAEKAGDVPKLLIEDTPEKEAEADEILNLSRAELEGLLVYTSGSTGKPKGAIHRQSVFSHYYTLNKMANRPLPPDAVHCCMAGFTFIAALFDLTIPIMTGGASLHRQ